MAIDRGRVINDRFFQHKSGSPRFTHSGWHREAPHWLTLFHPMRGLTKIVQMSWALTLFENMIYCSLYCEQGMRVCARPPSL